MNLMSAHPAQRHRRPDPLEVPHSQPDHALLHLQLGCVTAC